jgi:hypothetical protein
MKKNWIWWCISTVLALGGQGRRTPHQGQPRLHSKIMPQINKETNKKKENVRLIKISPDQKKL